MPSCPVQGGDGLSSGLSSNASRAYNRTRSGLRSAERHMARRRSANGRSQCVSGSSNSLSGMRDGGAQRHLPTAEVPVDPTVVDAGFRGDLPAGDRCRFESDFPMDQASYGYGIHWNACVRLTADASPAERSALLADTAARVHDIALTGTFGAEPRR